VGCVECGARLDKRAKRWRGSCVDEEGEPAELAFYRRRCALREFELFTTTDDASA
jgi:hypothetical protein